MKRKVCVLTTTRADYGYLRPVMLELGRFEDVDLQVIVSGAHLSAAYGMTVRDIEADGLPVAARIEIGDEGTTPSRIAAATGRAAAEFASAYAQLQPDILVLLGDRYEVLGAAVAMLPFVRPIAHIAGGEASEGAIDDGIRHALTKLSHLHFVSTDVYAKRVRQLGEDDWRITVSGAPTLDNLSSLSDLSETELIDKIGMSADGVLLATFHPVTLDASNAQAQMSEFLAALDSIDRPIIFTYPNADAHANELIVAIRAFVDRRPETRRFFPSLGTRGYFAVMRRAAAMVGNSSSGIIEAASFGLPVVDVGDRQRGRVHGANVLHAPYERAALSAVIKQALSAEMIELARNTKNPYGDGKSAERIVAVLRSVKIDSNLLKKRFCEL